MRSLGSPRGSRVLDGLEQEGKGQLECVVRQKFVGGSFGAALENRWFRDGEDWLESALWIVPGSVRCYGARYFVNCYPTVLCLIPARELFPLVAVRRAAPCDVCRRESCWSSLLLFLLFPFSSLFFLTSPIAVDKTGTWVPWREGVVHRFNGSRLAIAHSCPKPGALVGRRRPWSGQPKSPCVQEAQPREALTVVQESQQWVPRRISVYVFHSHDSWATMSLRSLARPSSGAVLLLCELRSSSAFCRDGMPTDEIMGAVAVVAPLATVCPR